MAAFQFFFPVAEYWSTSTNYFQPLVRQLGTAFSGLGRAARARIHLAGLQRPGHARVTAVKRWDSPPPSHVATVREHRLRPGMRRRARVAYC